VPNLQSSAAGRIAEPSGQSRTTGHDDQPEGVGWNLALHTGMRLGELLGLGWGDINWGKAGGGGTVTVARVQAEDEEGRPYLRDYPKSKSGVRVIPVGPNVVEVLREHRDRQGEEREGAPGGRTRPAWSSCPVSARCS
jgi:integrase